MNSELVISASERSDTNNNNETISVRLARYLEHVRNFKKENTKKLLRQAETRLVQQQVLHNNDLDELREQYETQLQENRKIWEKLGKMRTIFVEATAQRDKEALEHATKTLSFSNTMIGESDSRVKALEEANNTLNETVANLRASVQIEHSQVIELDNEVLRLQKVLASKIEEYNNIAKEEVDYSLSHEIDQFSTLMNQAEKRRKCDEWNASEINSFSM